MTQKPNHRPATLLLADGTVFSGFAIGADTASIGELCFNTAMTGYQEILTDPSYAGQIITFTAPHIGNTGCNEDDIESAVPHCAGLVIREQPTEPSSFRSQVSLDGWLKKHGIIGICGIDTRALTQYIRKAGAQNAMIFAAVPDSEFGVEEAFEELRAFPSMKGLELAADVTSKKSHEWKKPLWKLSPAITQHPAVNYHVVAVDYGAKHNILRHLTERGVKLTVVPAKTSAADILALNPDGVFLSNGPGDPAATAKYAVPTIQALIDTGKPIFGICLGHQLLGMTLGGKTEKMTQGHRGANHPVKDLTTGKVEITSQNHGFVVSKDDLPDDVEITHLSLFDQTIQGIRHKTKPIFSVQGHPEASPGPHDSAYLFDRFIALMDAHHG